MNNNKYGFIIGALIFVFLLITLRHCNNTEIEKYKQEQLIAVKKLLQEKDNLLKDSISVKDKQYSELLEERDRLDSLRKISRDRVVYVTKYKVYKLGELKTFSSDSQLALLKENLGDTNVFIIDSNIVFDTTHIQLINYKFLESDLQKEELQVVYADMSLCDSSYQVLDTMLINRNATIVIKDTLYSNQVLLTKNEINLRLNKEKELKKVKTNSLITNILLPSLTGVLGFGIGYFVYKFGK